jgi:hypothetical protein
MGNYDNIKKIVVGGTDVKRVMYQNEQIWPSSYYATLTVNWTFGGNYSIGAIPAAGGYAAASNWTIHIFRASDNQEVASYSVNPTITIGDTTNFAYSNNVWSANDRARNGLNSSSGTTVPQSAPARSCSLTATASYTYQGISVSASYGTVMTQNANNAVAGTGVYENLRISLNKYNTSASPAPAYATSGSSTGARITAVADYNTPYRFVDGTTGVQGLAYTYQQPDAVKTNSFTLSCSWCTFSNQTSSGAYVNVNSRGIDYDTNWRSTAIRATLGSQPSFYGEVTIYQAKNDRTTEYNYTDFALWASPASLTSAASSFSVFGTLGYKYRYHYDSGSYSDWSARTTTTATPTITNVSPAPTSYSGNSVSVPANTGSSARTYTVTANYTDPNGGNWNGYQVEIEQDYVAYTYDNPTVTIGYDTIGPAAHTEYPTVNVSQKVWQGSTLIATLTGTLNNGATSGTASGGGLSAQFSVSYSGYARSSTGASFNRTNGGVTTASRGTTEGLAREVAYSIYATATINGKSGSNSTAATVTQAENEAIPVAAQYQSVSIQSVSTSSINTCANTAVTATVKASWRDAGTKYSAYDDGDTTAYTGMTQHSNVTVTGADGVTMRVNNSTDYSNSTNQFYVNNLHNTSQASHSVVARFGGLTSESKTITQSADSIVANATKDWYLSVSIGSNQIWAGGGTATVAYTAYHTKYSYWQSGGTTDVVSGSEEQVNDTPSLSLTDMSSSGAFSLSGTTVTHRDMQNNVTTDSVKVHGATAGATDDVIISAINILTNQTVSGSWGTPYIVSHDYGIKSFTIDDYTSQSSPASFLGATTGYSVVARHFETPYHDRPVYKKYSSWSSEHNDDNHRAFYQNETEASGSSTETIGDPVIMYTGLSWVTIDTANQTLTFAAQQSGGQPRGGYVSAINANGGDYANVNVFQGGYASISRSPNFLIFDAAGGTKTFTVSYEYTTFDVSYPRPTITMPSLIITPSNGGSASGTGSVTFTVVCGQKDTQDLLQGTITIHPTATGLSDLTIRVSQ